jgi:EAL domain-containing protein (putative c-di-GMP-specific phosphodiesterase class I)
VARGGNDAALARTIIALADMLSLRCVAEGIEAEDQRVHLQALGCALGQGYLFARPLDAQAVEALFEPPGAALPGPGGAEGAPVLCRAA